MRITWLALIMMACVPDPGPGGVVLPPPASGPDDGGTMPPPVLEPYVASDSIVRRLSQSEIDNTLADLAGDDTRPSGRFLGEDEYRPYDNDYTVQRASQALIDSIDVMVEDVATRLVQDPMRRSAIMPCAPAGPDDAVCFRAFIEQFGRRTFRRPLDPVEVDAYLELLAYATEDNPYVDNDFYTAVALAVRAMLMDPQFLYRIEIGTPTETPGVVLLDGYEIAARMSYLLWGSAPDEDLLADAAGGALDTGTSRRLVAARMMEADRAKRQLRRFHSMWLGYRAVPGSVQLLAAFNQETASLIDRVVFERKESYLRLFTSNETYLDDFLADHYGIPRPQNGAGWVAYTDGSMRAGILSHGSVLAAFGKFSDTSPTQRGILVRNRLMCQAIPQPPPNVDVDQPPSGSGGEVCKKDRYLAHVEIPSCAQCHLSMDPIGFGLESFDIQGRSRTEEAGLPQCTIDGAGELPGFGTFHGPKELAEKLVSEKLIDRCVIRQYFQYSAGRPILPIEEQPLEALGTSFAASGQALDQLILDHVASDAFALKKEGRE